MPADLPQLFIGLMSGTSLDGADGVLAEFGAEDGTCGAGGLQVLSDAHVPMPPNLRAELLALNSAGDNELHRAALAANRLIDELYVPVVRQLLLSAKVAPQQICAIGAHGQTVRHQPQQYGGVGYTIQLNAPALLAERTGIAVVADFRSRDVAAGGQGAPLVPAFHAEFFGRAGHTISVLNLGGMSNLTVLHADGTVLGFDCGPANVLLDAWCMQHTGKAFDAGGMWAAGGQINEALLAQMCAEPYFALPPPKSTGRDLFNTQWLARQLDLCNQSLGAQDIQATLLALTVQTCAQAVRQFAPLSQFLVVCGGGALNDALMHQLRHALPETVVEPSNSFGLPALNVEATAFAWLAKQCVQGIPANLPLVTGARGRRILGAFYAA